MIVVVITGQRYCELLFPTIQPGSSSFSQRTVDLFKQLFNKWYLRILKEIKQWKKNKTTTFVYIDPSSPTFITDTPITKELLSFFKEVFYYVFF